jgi:hypothetical protein
MTQLIVVFSFLQEFPPPSNTPKPRFIGGLSFFSLFLFLAFFYVVKGMGWLKAVATALTSN